MYESYISDLSPGDVGNIFMEVKRFPPGVIRWCSSVMSQKETSPRERMIKSPPLQYAETFVGFEIVSFSDVSCCSVPSAVIGQLLEILVLQGIEWVA
jgi:hypothetical protein